MKSQKVSYWFGLSDMKIVFQNNKPLSKIFARACGVFRIGGVG
jgi:hypothetical protein